MIQNGKTQIFSLGENKLTTNYELELDLGNQPWANDFLSSEDVGKEKSYPLKLVYCNNSELLQLSHFVPKETMFKNHSYLSGQKLGFKNLINFESADNICELSKQNGVPTINDFFNESSVRTHIKEKSIKLINASGVFFHLEELDSVIRGINYCLSDDGIFVVQCMYAGAMVDNLNFDTIYHEHLCYYTLNSLTKLLEKYGLYLEDATFNEIHSGSIICKFRKNKVEYTDRTNDLIQRDKKYNLNSFIEFSKKIEENRWELKKLLLSLKEQNKKIYAYGAPVKGNTLMNYMGITNEIIDKVVEVNPYKIGTYTPGSHIPVVKETVDDLPDYYLMLSHNFEKEILEKNAHIIKKGVKFIIPFPTIKII